MNIWRIFYCCSSAFFARLDFPQAQKNTAVNITSWTDRWTFIANGIDCGEIFVHRDVRIPYLLREFRHSSGYPLPDTDSLLQAHPNLYLVENKCSFCD